MPVSRIPVPRTIKRERSDTTLSGPVDASPAQLKAARQTLRSPSGGGGFSSKANLAPSTPAPNTLPSHSRTLYHLAPTPRSPLATPPRRKIDKLRLSSYGVPVGMSERRPSGLRRVAGVGAGAAIAAADGAGERGAEKRITVCVRKRPFSARELQGSSQDCVRADVQRGSVVISAGRTRLDGLSKYSEDFSFVFDRVFDETCSNDLVYSRIIAPLTEFAMGGGKATCFAYGQTGSGKTHTMFHERDGKPRRATPPSPSPSRHLLPGDRRAPRRPRRAALLRQLL